VSKLTGWKACLYVFTSYTSVVFVVAFASRLVSRIYFYTEKGILRLDFGADFLRSLEVGIKIGALFSVITLAGIAYEDYRKSKEQ
jgi:hypothetical protein